MFYNLCKDPRERLPLFCTNGIIFDEEFKQVFMRSVYEHCMHIKANLGYSYYYRGNHYLAHITGLLFGAALLPPSREQKQWLCFASKEIKQEIKNQFYPEGSNFEGSTAYHRLASDMASYSMALITALERKTMNSEIADRLYGAVMFLNVITRPDDSFSQVGDNDSGLFFRLSPTGDIRTAEEIVGRYQSLLGYVPEQPGEPYLDETMNDGRMTASALTGLFKSNEFEDYKKKYPLEYSLTHSLCGPWAVHENNWKAPQVQADTELLIPALNFRKKNVISSGRVDLTDGLQRFDFPQFGIYIFRSYTLYLLVNATDNGQKGNGGHAHNDKLSFELFINGKAIYEDPGTFVYTALPELRNMYRSVYSHNTIQTGIEQNEFINIFSMKNQTKCTVLSVSKTGICVLVKYRDIIHTREFIIGHDSLIIMDACNVPFELPKSDCSVTNGYGKMRGR